MRVLQTLLSDLEPLGVPPDLVQLGLPDIKSDLAMPCFTLVKKPENPQSFAEKLAAKIKHPAIKKATALNGYLNLWLSSQFLAQTLKELPPLSQRLSYSGLVLIDFFAPNLAKPLSVGHLRNLLQGRALVNFHQALGYEVITDNHLGDSGAVFGKWVVGLLRYGSGKLLENMSLKELGDIYVQIQKDLEAEKSQNSSNLLDEAQNWLSKLEQGDKEAWMYHALFTRLTQTEMNRILDKFEIKFDFTLGESFYYQLSTEILQDLETRGLAQRQSDNSLIIDLKKENIKTPLLIQKSNGSHLYATSDIATLAYREKRWQPKKIIYVVGQEQKLHFEQLFGFNRLTQYTQAELIHHAYGLVEEINAQGQRQKMSSRREAILLNDVLHKACHLARDFLIKNQDKPEDIEKDVLIVALGALTFQEFSRTKNKNILFDWERLFSLSEMSGPYAQYAVSRLKSILDKAPSTIFSPNLDYDWQSEHELIFKILRFEDVLEESHQTLELSKIATHIFELAQSFNRYYEKTRVIDAPIDQRESRLWFLQILYQHFILAFSILGVKIPSKM